MGKRRRKGSELHRGPFTAAEIERELQRIGFTCKPGGNHPQYIHPARGGKVAISRKWTSIKASDAIFRSIARQAGLTSQQLLRVLNGLEP